MTDSPFQPVVGLTRDGVTGRPVLRLHCRYGQPAERIWRALTDDAELSQWTPWQVRIDPVPGGVIEIGFTGRQATEGTVTSAEPPRLLEFHWQGMPGSAYDENLRWSILPQEASSALVLEVTLQDLPHASQSAAGYHLSLGHLDTLLAGRPVHRAEDPPSDPRFRSLVEHYDEILPRKP